MFLTSQTGKELLFSRDNLWDLNGVLFWPLFLSKIVLSDASATGCGAFIQGSTAIFNRNWSPSESQKSSTYRQLATVQFALKAFIEQLSASRVHWNTDIRTNNQIGSMIQEQPDFQIFQFSISCKCISMLFRSRRIRTLRLTYSVRLKILMILPYMMMYCFN